MMSAPKNVALAICSRGVIGVVAYFTTRPSRPDSTDEKNVDWVTVGVCVGTAMEQRYGLGTYNDDHQLQALLPHRNKIIVCFLPLLIIVSLGTLYVVFIVLSVLNASPNERTYVFADSTVHPHLTCLEGPWVAAGAASPYGATWVG
jgi:hypothetical protein